MGQVSYLRPNILKISSYFLKPNLFFDSIILLIVIAYIDLFHFHLNSKPYPNLGKLHLRHLHHDQYGFVRIHPHY